MPDIGEVTLVKRAGSRTMRLSVTPTGIRVSMPHWTPYSAAQSFVLGHIAWIQAELAKNSRPPLESGQKVGKLHYLRFEHALGGQAAGSRVTGTEVIVRLSPGEQTTDQTVQERARQTSIRALKREAERLLKPRLQSLADRYDMEFAGFAVKQLKRRWGSCDQSRNITLNLFLMELPWEFIDYVMLHELAHTRHMNHGEGFWAELVRMEPRARGLSKQLRSRQPIIGPWEP